MGTSTDAMLCFGHDYGEEPEFPWTNDEGNSSEDDLQDWWVEEKGFNQRNPWDELAKSSDYKSLSWSQRHEVEAEFKLLNQEAIDYYYQQRELLIKKLPVEVVSHCSDSYPMYILAVKGSLTIAARGYPKNITHLMVTPEARKPADDFCKEFEIDWMPQWLLCSWWDH